MAAAAAATTAPPPTPTPTVLITILTSSDISLLNICFRSVFEQTQHTETDTEPKTKTIFTTVVIVNTKNSAYFGEVKAFLLKKYGFTNVIETESNGRPGKGHNSELQYFLEHQEFDFFFPIDGDDLLYPTALLQIDYMLTAHFPAQTPFDALLHLGLDRVNWHSTTGSIVLTKNTFLNTTYEETNLLQEKNITIDDPFDESKTVATITCPVRTFLLNRKAAHVANLRWDETSTMLEDYPPFLALFEAHLKGTIQLAGTANRYMYIYNQLNENNVTSTFIRNVADRDAANVSFKNSIAKFELARSQWKKVRDIPFYKLEKQLPIFRQHLAAKVLFIRDGLVRHYFTKHINMLEKLYTEKKWTELILETQKLFDVYEDMIKTIPELLENVRLNLGVAHYKCGEANRAMYYWNKISSNTKAYASAQKNITTITIANRKVQAQTQTQAQT